MLSTVKPDISVITETSRVFTVPYSEEKNIRDNRKEDIFYPAVSEEKHGQK